MATELRRRGVPKWEVSGMLGHRDIDDRGSPTTDAYAVFDPHYLGSARAAIDAYLEELSDLVPQLRSANCSTIVNSKVITKPLKLVVGAAGIEPATPTMSRQRSKR